MKKCTILIKGLLMISLLMTPAIGEDTKTPDPDTLSILWTSGDPDVALKMVFMYASAAKNNQWFDNVELIIWGPSSKLTSENKEIQLSLQTMMKNGVIVRACKACADQYGVSDILKSLGIDVKYMGKPLTDILKSNRKLLTF